MKNRNLIVVALLSLFTSGIYSIFWLVITKDEIQNQGVNIPSALLLAVPLVNIWWLWKYSQGVEKVTNKGLSGILVFVLLLFVSPLAIILIQDSFNNAVIVEAVSDSPVASASPIPPTNPSPPTDTVG